MAALSPRAAAPEAMGLRRDGRATTRQLRCSIVNTRSRGAQGARAARRLVRENYRACQGKTLDYILATIRHFSCFSAEYFIPIRVNNWIGSFETKRPFNESAIFLRRRFWREAATKSAAGARRAGRELAARVGVPNSTDLTAVTG
jgi:hypothetical protein